MRELKLIFLAPVGVAAGIAAAAACGSSSTNGGPDSGQDGASSDGTSSGSASGSSGGTGSSSSGSSSGTGSGSSGADANLLPMGMQIGTPPTQMDGGLFCLGQFMSPAACAAPQVCCWGDQSQTPPPLAGCTSASSCTGSVIACSATAQCSAGQVCCFVFTSDAGAGAGGTMGPFAAQCATSCPTGDMIHYRLCGTSSDCAAGEICNNMAPYAPYCFAQPGSPDGGAVDGGDATSTADASDAGPG
jgi:hypothetical protein